MPGRPNTVSVTTAPPISSAAVRPTTVSIGISAFLQRVPHDDPQLAQALGAGGADVIVAQHVEHAGAGEAQISAELTMPEHDRRQHQMAHAVEEPGARPAVAGDREPAETHRED